MKTFSLVYYKYWTKQSVSRETKLSPKSKELIEEDDRYRYKIVNNIYIGAFLVMFPNNLFFISFFIMGF